MSATLQILVDSVDEGMLIISPEGLVRLTNQAASHLFPVVVGKSFPAEELLKHVSAVVRGYAHLPLEFEMDAPTPSGHGDRLRLKLLESPVGGGYLLMIRNISESARFENVMANFANLMSVELGTPMKQFSQKMFGLLAACVSDMEKRAALSDEMRATLRMGEEVLGRMTQLATFAQVFSKSPILASERLPLMSLINALLDRVKPLMEERNIKLKVLTLPSELPVIYGSRDWLVEALYGYVEHLVKNCRVRSDLELQMRPFGNFVSLQIRNHGRALPKQLEVRKTTPFSRPEGDGESNLGLGLVLCKHIVELHRGHLRLDQEDGDITAFSLELPAGAPAETINPDLGAEQAKRYAKDLTQLMQRQRQQAAQS